ncbi:hypothetical protein NQ318_014217 [Aromia moschata]|uniref:Uncharacterized protein n=1 Tax=Aromia moschata TaxID=1265417 RepID=A0AAV8YYZ9_9CUCU|nr:hypothetical protein NQ318_014217 [Aromia moschata]
MIKPKLFYILVLIFVVCIITTLYQMQIIRLRDKIVTLESKGPKASDRDWKTDEDNLVVLYNRVPKTGSTSFVGVAYDLCKRNKFHVLHVNITANNHILSLTNQLKFISNVTNWNAMKPALYHGHFAFPRFQQTFDDCVAKQLPDCDPNNMKPGNKWALTEAKKNLINNYFLVGVTEELEDFISVLEQTLPRVFRGATEHYVSSNRSHLRQTVQKDMPSEETVRKIKDSLIWQMENELYEFTLEHFHFQKKYTLKK